MVRPINEKQQSQQQQSFSSPYKVQQLDQIPTPFLNLLVVLGPTLCTLANMTDILLWRTPQPRQPLLFVLVWILLCLWTWPLLAFGIPSVVLYKLASEWLASRTSKARRQTLEKKRLQQRLLSQQHIDPDDDDERVVQQRLQQQQEEEQEVLISRKVVVDHVSLDDTLKHLAVINEGIDAVRTQTRRVLVYINEQRAVAVLSALMYVWPAWVLLCWALDTRGVLALIGTVILVRPSPWYRVVMVTIKKNIVLRYLLASLWGYGVALVVSTINSMKVWKGFKGWGCLVWERAKKEKAKAIQVMQNEVYSADKQEGTRSEMIFQFEVLENQRWWLGVNWTTNLMPSERGPWTDNQLKPIVRKEGFELPEATMKTTQINSTTQRVINKIWNWVDGDWWVDMTGELDGKVDHNGWAYGNNAWKQLSGSPGMQTFTRTRRWCRRAKLVERELDQVNSSDKKKD